MRGGAGLLLLLPLLAPSSGEAGDWDSEHPVPRDPLYPAYDGLDYRAAPPGQGWDYALDYAPSGHLAAQPPPPLVHEGDFRESSVECFDCHARVGTCNEGKCSGKACVKIQASVGERSSVTKGCTQLAEEASCVRTAMVGVDAVRCVCAYDRCNADDELRRQGLLQQAVSRGSSVGSAGWAGRGPQREKRGRESVEAGFRLAPSHLAMLVFLSLFLTASFSLLLFNSVCVHLC